MTRTTTTISVAAAAGAAILAASIPALFDEGGGGSGGQPGVTAVRNPCTDGIPPGSAGDCFCDKVEDGRISLGAASLAWCEDWEAPSLYYLPGQDARVVEQNNVYPWGPVYDSEIGRASNRGGNGYMWRSGNISSPRRCAWSNGYPAAPTYGEVCTAGQQCFGIKIWTEDDRWDVGPDQSNGNVTCMSIIGDGDFDAEVATITDPVIPGGDSGVFDGHFVHGERNPGCIGGDCDVSNDDKAAGIHWQQPFPTRLTDMGVTVAYGFSSNIDDAGICRNGAAAWKMMEFGTNTVGANENDGNFMFSQMAATFPGQNNTMAFPFHTFYARRAIGQSGTDCTAQTGVAIETPTYAPYSFGNFTLHEGVFMCSEEREFRVRPKNADYDFDADWGLGRWGCARAEYTNLGQANQSGKIWFGDKLLIHYEGLDGTEFRVANAHAPVGPGYGSLKLVNYYNGNQPGTSGVPGCYSDETVYRYIDNLVITDGAAVSCDDIGFVDEPTPEPPTETISGGRLTGGQL